jgi:transcriptional regulator with XRE-family HTH domain
MAHMTTPIIIRDLRQLGLALQKRRYANGQTIRSLGARAGFSSARITGWENAHRTPNAASLIRLADALGYDLALIPRAEPKPEHASEDCYCTDTYTDPWCKPRETAPETAPASTHSASRSSGVAGTANGGPEGAQTSTGGDT